MRAESERRRVMTVITDLVNSAPAPGREESLATVADLARRFEEWIVTEVAPPEPADVAALHILRERLRAVFLAPAEEERIAIVNGLLAGAKIHPRIVKHGAQEVHVHYFSPYCSVAEHLQADCAMSLAMLLVDGGGSRLRICSAPECSNGFYDSSKNHSRLYCDKQGCANRIHAAAYRARVAHKPPA